MCDPAGRQLPVRAPTLRRVRRGVRCLRQRRRGVRGHGSHAEMRRDVSPLQYHVPRGCKCRPDSSGCLKREFQGGIMSTKKKIEVFSAGCSACKETIEMVKRLAASHELIIHDMNKSE